MKDRLIDRPTVQAFALICLIPILLLLEADADLIQPVMTTLIWLIAG